MLPLLNGTGKSELYVYASSWEICCACARLACVDPTNNEFARDEQGFSKCQLFIFTPSVKDRSLHPEAILDSTGSRDWKSGKESFINVFLLFTLFLEVLKDF